MVASVFSASEKILRAVADGNPQGNHGWAAEILKQIGERSPEELKNLQKRMPFIQAILSVRKISRTVKEFLIFLTDLGTLPKPSSITPLKGDWVSKMIKAEVRAWQTFANWSIDSDRFGETLKAIGRERMEILIGYGFEPGMLPELVLTKDMNITKWIKPGSWVWQQLSAGKLFVEIDGKSTKLTEARLSGHPVLFDRRCKPNGRQCWENDILLKYIIEELQQENQLPAFDWCDRGSRFGLSKLDWAKVASGLEDSLEFPRGTFRLESVWEWSVLSQYKSGLSRAKDGTTDTWIWFREYFGGRSDSLDGGSVLGGGLADVDYVSSGIRWDLRSARLLGDLGSLVF